MKMSTLDWIAMILLVIGGLNWGLVGLFNYDLVSSLFGTADSSILTRIIFILVGLSALWVLYMSTMRGSKEM